METPNVSSAKIEIDTKDAKKNIEELTLAVNECISTFEKLEKVMDKFTGKSATNTLPIEVPVLLNGKVSAQSIVHSINDIDRVKETF
ncbi:hypothetical protein [Bacillus thuringiensis]|uniref:Uncharacterized protein n=1 Tax=Bacillus thuringiensis serovar andalousiensis TaxID=257985 RepID=A0A6H0TST8_BACTU|nr:hypothetical protein [Bacillus thuringiensis]QIW22366.1 hypothetical protein EVG22_30520 [Bacillus thuringiensis serovar andalousiensis]